MMAGEWRERLMRDVGNAQKGDELKKKFDERQRKNEEKKRKEDELYEWMAKLNVKDRQKMKRETQGGFTN